MVELSKHERERYEKHLLLSEIGEQGQRRLKESRVLVVGAGGLGCPVLASLAAAGVGTLAVYDNDVVQGSNLQRQLLYNESSIGKLKVEQAVSALSKINPHVELRPFSEMISTENVGLVSDYDVVVDGTDNFGSRYLLNDACAIYGVPLVAASLFGFEGQLSVFHYQGGPTLRCLYPEPPAVSERPACADFGILGAVAQLMGNFQALEVIKVLLQKNAVLSGKLLLLDMLSCEQRLVKFKATSEGRQSSCLREQQVYQVYNTGCTKPAQEMSAQDLETLLQLEPQLQLLDVREPSEFQAGDIACLNIPLSKLGESQGDLKKDCKTLVFCESGVRSLQAIDALSERINASQLYSLQGGMRAWRAFHSA